MKIKLLILLFLFSNLTHYSGQNNTSAGMIFYNIGFGSVCSGIGALINKKPGEKWKKVFFKGIYQGALGGLLVYQSKSVIRKISETHHLAYSWPAKILNSAGNSIIENAASNRNFWEKWHINIGFNRFEFYTKGKFRVKYKIMPVSMVLTTVASVNARFETGKTLGTGEFVFSKDLLSSDRALGISFGNAVIIHDQLGDGFYQILSHEFIHIYQYYDFNFINAYLNKSYEKLKARSKTFNTLDRIFYFDLQGPLMKVAYLLENINNQSYYDNFYEYEAEFYAK